MKIEDAVKEMKEMKEIEGKVTDLSAARDKLTDEIRKLTGRRNALITTAKLIALPESPLKAQILAAVGIKSTESVGGAKK